MILTISPNAAMDYIYHIDNFKIGSHNRVNNPTVMAGSKGINCLRALKSLGAKAETCIAIAGDNGKRILNRLEEEKLKAHYISISGESRNAITIMHDNDIQTEIVEEGPKINLEYQTLFFRKIEKTIKESSNLNTITINGSVNSENSLFYLDLLIHLKSISDKSLKVLMDISGVQLSSIIENDYYCPYFIKPNITEFSELIGSKLTDKSSVSNALLEFNTQIPIFMVSCGGDGAIVKYDNSIYDIKIPDIQVINPTGAGDSTVAGIAYATDQNYSFVNAMKLGMACGISNTMQKGVGVINNRDVKKLVNKITVEKIY